MQSVLDRVTRSDLSDDPFPHLVVRPALDDDLFERLAADFPRPDVMRKIGDGGKYSYEAHDLLAATRPGDVWHDFVACHTSNSFYRQVVHLFGDIIEALHPSLPSRLRTRLEDLQTGVRFAEGPRDVALEAQCIHSDGTATPMRIIGPHVDRPVALYAGLIYFRRAEDRSTGGDLELYRFKRDCRAYVSGTRQVPDRLVETVKVIPYQENTLVLFPHSPDSLHGVSMRSAASSPRLHVNLVGELGFEIYDLSRYPSLESLEALESRRDLVS